MSLPHPFGPRLEHCDADGAHVRVLWLVPITATEVAYRRETGPEALEQLFGIAGADILDPHRTAVVRRRFLASGF